MLVDAEDRRVRRSMPLQVERHRDHLLLGVLALSDVLAHADHRGLFWSRRVVALRKISTRPLSCTAGTRSCRCRAPAARCRARACRRLELGRDELLDEVAVEHLPFLKRDLHRLLVPLVHLAVLVDAEDRRVRVVDQALQVLHDAAELDLLLLELGDVLADADAHDRVVRAAARRVRQDVDGLALPCTAGTRSWPSRCRRARAPRPPTDSRP